MIKIFGKSYVFVSFQIGLQSLCLYYLDFYHRFTALADPAENMFKRVTYNLMLLDDISKGKIHPIQRIFHFMQILWENSQDLIFQPASKINVIQPNNEYI